jgi:hypothetical protein
MKKHNASRLCVPQYLNELPWGDNSLNKLKNTGHKRTLQDEFNYDISAIL